MAAATVIFANIKVLWEGIMIKKLGEDLPQPAWWCPLWWALVREATAAKFKPHHIQAIIGGIPTVWLAVANITAVLTVMGLPHPCPGPSG